MFGGASGDAGDASFALLGSQTRRDLGEHYDGFLGWFFKPADQPWLDAPPAPGRPVAPGSDAEGLSAARFAPRRTSTHRAVLPQVCEGHTDETLTTRQMVALYHLAKRTGEILEDEDGQAYV